MSRYSRILVTGGAGFIGSHLAERLLKEDYEVKILDLISKNEVKLDFLKLKNLTYLKGDIRNFDDVKRAVKDVEAVFHEAALTSVPRSVENPLPTSEINIIGTLNLLTASMNAGVKRFIYASSSSVYGDSPTLPLHEKLCTNPVSPYAVSKLSAENLCKVFFKVHGFETTSLRYFNVYGPRQKYGPYSGVITIFIKRLLEGKNPIIYGDGEQKRDFTNVGDVVEANMLALYSGNSIGETFNIARGEATTISKLASILIDITGQVGVKPENVESRLGDIKFSYADISKARKILGYEPKVPIKEGLTDLVEYFKSN